MPLEFLRQGKSRVNASFPTAVTQAPLIAFFVTRSSGVDQEVKTVDVFCISVAEPLMLMFSAHCNVLDPGRSSISDQIRHVVIIMVD